MERSASLSASFSGALAGSQPYRELFDNAAEGYIVTNPVGIIWEVNHAAAALLGETQAHFIGMPLEQILASENRRTLKEHLRHLKRGTPVDALEVRVNPHDAPPYVAMLKAKGIHDAGGRLIALNWLIRNINLRKTVEAALTRSNELLAALGHVVARIETTNDAAKLMETLGRELRQLGLCSTIASLEPDGQSLIVRYFSIESDALTIVERLTGITIVGFRMLRERFILYRQIIESGNPLFVTDWLSVICALLPRVPGSIIERAGVLARATENTRAIYLPLKIDGQVLGMMAIWGDQLQEQDLGVLSIFASQVASALKSAQLYEELHSSRERLRELTRQVLSAQDEERRRVSRELHDEAGQSLTALSISLKLIAGELTDECGAYEQRIQEIACLADKTLEHLRLLAHNLRPPALDAIGLNASLEHLCAEFARHTRLDVTYQGAEMQVLPGIVSESFYRFLQEALTNVARHAQAQCVRVGLNEDGATVSLSVEDDGLGFIVRGRTNGQDRGKGLGLTGMQERFELLGGNIEINSRPTQGTRLIARVPLHEAA